jgi:hypothetical protein
MAFVCSYDHTFPDNFPEDVVMTRDEFYDEWYTDATHKLRKAKAAFEQNYTNETFAAYGRARKNYLDLCREMRGELIKWD